MNKRFEFLEHTADTKIRAYGKSLEDAFVSVVIATTQVMTDVNKVYCVESKSINVESKTEKSLLYDFLDEILFLFDTEGFLAASVDDLVIEKNGKYKLSCIIKGDFASNGYDVHTAIKAITYSEMEITKSDKGVVIQIVHDL